LTARIMAVLARLAFPLCLLAGAAQQHPLNQSNGDGGPAVRARLVYPASVAVAQDGSLYIAEAGAHRIRKVSPRGVITTVVGTGQRGYSGDGGPASQARIAGPHDLTFDAETNSLYVADSFNHCIRRVDRQGVITTVAGNGKPGFSGDGGDARQANLNGPQGITFDRQGKLLIADTFNSAIRSVDRRNVNTTVAGSMPAGFGGDGGPALKALLTIPYAVAVAPHGDIYVCDTANSRIRRIDASGIIHHVAGSGPSAGVFGAGFNGDEDPADKAQIHSPVGLAFDARGTLYLSDTGNSRIRTIEEGVIRTIAGTGIAGFSGDGGKALEAELNTPQKLAFDEQGNLYFADRPNHRVRRIDKRGIITTVAGSSEATGTAYELVRE